MTASVAPSLIEVATTARSMLVSMLKSTLLTDKTNGSCLYATILLQKLISQFGEVVSVKIRGGDGVGDGGYKGQCGTWHGHYWLEVDAGDGKFIVDITADQFGESAVLVLALPDLSKIYVPGEQLLVDSHVSDTLEELLFDRELVRI